MPEATPAGITKVHLVDATGVTISGTGGGAMTVADGADVTQGAKADTVWDGVAASASVVAILKKIATSGASAGLTDTQLRASAVPVSLASTTITGSVAVTGPLTDTQLRASAVPVSLASTTITGTVTSDTELPAAAALTDTDANPTAPYVGAANMGWNNTNWVRLKAGLGDGASATGFLNIVPMMFNGTNYDRLRGDLTNGLKVQGTVTATGPLTDTQLRASAVPVSLASTTITGSVAVTGPLTDTQLRASAVPVDVSDRAARLVGVVTASGTQARAAAITANPLLVGARAANYPTKPTAVAAGQLVEPVADLEGVLLTRPRQVATYAALYRLALAAASSKLTFTFTANTDKQLATIYHAVGATKNVRIRRVWVQIISTGAVAGEVQLELRQLSATTAPATGNPAITPGKRDGSLAAAEATCLALPTTAGSEVAANSPIASSIVNLAASAGTASGTGLVPQDPGWIKLYDEASADDEEQAPLIRAGVAEGWAVVGRSTAAVPFNFIVRIVFTEE